MATIDQFLAPTPPAWQDDPAIQEWVYQLRFIIDDLTRPDGAVATAEATAAAQEAEDQLLMMGA
jgi:hypothetical protein